jgi:sarcosine oxidase/L-pipecolate oxidase
VSFVCGKQGTVTAFQKDTTTRRIVAAQTGSGYDIQGDYFILSAGAWSTSLAPMYNSTISTAQVLAFIKGKLFRTTPKVQMIKMSRKKHLQ